METRAILAHATAAEMDEEEIEGWYEEEKQRCMDKYLADLEEGKNKESSQKKYEDALQKAIAKYNKSMFEKLDSKRKKKGFSIIDKIKSMIARK